MTSNLRPGCNLPSLMAVEGKIGEIFVEHITAEEDGTLTHDLDGMGTHVGGGFQHYALVPSWTTQGAEIAFFRVAAGVTVRVYATADDEITISSPRGDFTVKSAPVVVYHQDVDPDEIRAYYRG